MTDEPPPPTSQTIRRVLLGLGLIAFGAIALVVSSSLESFLGGVDGAVVSTRQRQVKSSTLHYVLVDQSDGSSVELEIPQALRLACQPPARFERKAFSTTTTCAGQSAGSVMLLLWFLTYVASIGVGGWVVVSTVRSAMSARSADRQPPE